MQFVRHKNCWDADEKAFRFAWVKITRIGTHGRRLGEIFFAEVGGSWMEGNRPELVTFHKGNQKIQLYETDFEMCGVLTAEICDHLNACKEVAPLSK